jgi:transcriptional regulator with XRE-family HTH domain
MPEPDDMRGYVSRRIKEIRNGFGKTGISQEALAASLGVTTNTISRWETGIYEPALNDLERLSRELCVSILEFFPKADPTNKRTQHVDALLRTAQGLNEDDLDELRRYAEFRRARGMYGRKTAGRKRK